MDNSEPEDINLMHAQIYDKKLKSALWQAMKVNGGEPENMEKIQNFKGLSEYPKDTILGENLVLLLPYVYLFNMMLLNVSIFQIEFKFENTFSLNFKLVY